MSAQFISAKVEWKDWSLHSTSCQKHLPNPAPGRSKSGGFGDCGENNCSDFRLSLQHKRGKNDQDSSGFPTGFMLEHFASSKSMRSSTPPAVLAGSTGGLRASPWTMPPGLVTSSYWPDSLSLQLAPTPANHSRSSVSSWCV